EGDYAKTERSIRALLAQSGAMARPRDVLHPSGLTTPETYIGTMRAQGFGAGGRPRNGTHTYPAPPTRLKTNEFWLSGRWTVSRASADAGRGAGLDAQVVGRHVYFVLSSPVRARTVRVWLDGRPQPPVVVRGQRLYEVARPPDLRPHRLALRLASGTSGFSF